MEFFFENAHHLGVIDLILVLFEVLPAILPLRLLL